MVSGYDIRIPCGLPQGDSLFVGLMVGAVVAIAGPIGFVGLMIPHVCRMILGSDHRRLVPATLLGGGCFLPLCDTAARVILAPAELPVGIVTALLGGPFFIPLHQNPAASLRGWRGYGFGV